jgi:hypothetical protein
MRFVKWLGCGVWAGSWYLMYLEVTRWHHVKPTLRFNSGPVPGSEVQPRPGLPLKLLYVACAVSPLVVVATSVMQASGRRSRVAGATGSSPP